MALTNRQKLTVLSLLIYWGGIFVLGHIPVPQLIYKAQVSDKSLHFICYLILVFLLWFAINPDRKVNWAKPAVWWILLVIVWYGVVDEWLQSYVGRNADIADFLFDLAGAVSGLVLLWIFSFWPASLVVTGVSIFLLTNISRADLSKVLPLTDAMFHLFGYGFFTMLWLRHIYHYINVNITQLKWILTALSLPAGLLVFVKVFSAVLGKDVDPAEIMIAATAIMSVVVTVYCVGLFRRVLGLKLRSSDD